MHNNIGHKVLFLFIIISISLAACAEGDTEENPRMYHGQGIGAYHKKDYALFLKHLKKAQRLAPENPKIMYDLARAYALDGDKKAGIEYLQKAVDVGYYLNPQHASDFASLEKTDAFKAIQKKNKEKKIIINNSKIAFEIPEKDLIPEGIAYDPVENIFYLGSVHKRKIISITNNGTINEFAAEMQDGLWSVIGIEVDANRRILWVTSGATFAMKGIKSKLFGLTGVFKYNLTSGKLIKKYLLDERPVLHLFNDLTINSRGDVFITDSSFGAVYTISAKVDKLELFVKPRHFTYPNGITLSQNDEYLFAVSTEGISVIDANTGSCSTLSPPEGMNLCLIDGFYFYKNSLIAIQNDNWQRRVIQFFLKKYENGPKETHYLSMTKQNLLSPNKSSFRVKEHKIIESGNPLFNVPTTGVILGDVFYYIANSQINEFNHDGGFFPIDKLRPVVILKANLPTG